MTSTRRHAWLCGVVLLGALVVTEGTTRAEPQWLRLSWSQDPSSSLTVSWSDASGPGRAEIRHDGGTATPMDATQQDTGTSELGVTYQVTFTGLSANTEYEYRVQSSNVWSSWHQAKTAPAPGSCAPFRFVAGGDSRGEEIPWVGTYRESQWPDVMTLVASEQPLFVLHSGDYVRSGEKAEQWVTELSDLTTISADRPFFLTIGNHDNGPGEGETAFFNALFGYPTDGPDSTEDYYSLIIGNLQVIVLSTETFDMDQQISWMDQELTAHENQVDWTLVMFHRPIWSSGAHGGNDGDAPRAEVMVPVLDAHHVDLVVSGHDHDYERFHPSLGGYGTPRQILPLSDDGGSRGVAQGVVYIVSGGYGALVNPLFSQTVEGSAVAANHLHYIVCDVAGDQLTLTARDLGTQSLSSPPQIEGDLDHVVFEKDQVHCSNDPDAGIDGGPDGGVDAAVGLDGSVADSGSGDAGVVEDAARGDAGAQGSAHEPSGCNCRATGTGPSLWWLLLALFFIMLEYRLTRKRHNR
ncbi:MAG: metallophosphoesterase family protein [Deltaproteobacteria bacterium]|nr:metallophosphoesterase family protein [Deltaproteobacteria bacterium]